MAVVFVLPVLVLVFLLWILPMVLASKLFTEKGYSPWAGTLLGCFLGWLGVLIAALLPAKTATATFGTTKTCPECAETIQAEAKVCRFCGNRDLEAALPVPIWPPPHTT